MNDRVREIKDSATVQLDRIRTTTQDTVDTHCNKFREQVCVYFVFLYLSPTGLCQRRRDFQFRTDPQQHQRRLREKSD